MGYSFWTGGIAAKEGFWGPTSSTLNWCEEDYVLTPYVAEFWNSTSNVFFLALAWLGLRTLQKLEAREMRHYVALWSLILVAIGSILFHGTLWYSYQMLDELPMIVNACIIIFCALQVFPDSARTKVPLALALSTYAFATTAIYLHIKSPEFLALSHGSLTAFLAYILPRQILRLARDDPRTTDALRLRGLWKLNYWTLYAYLIGGAFWGTENALCSALRKGREAVGSPFGFLLEFHVWWHLFAALGSYGVILLVVYLRLLATYRHDVQLKWFRHVFPMLESSRSVGKKAV
ncbi:ceramidase [Chytriomyces sp. MP71]|nr:ceramidase [Chytriomyces sp. MP71]